MKGMFDYVKYDQQSELKQALLKTEVDLIRTGIEKQIECPRSKEYALKALEECYMWIGKGIRNDQISRNGSAELQEERTNS